MCVDKRKLQKDRWTVVQVDGWMNSLFQEDELNKFCGEESLWL